MFMITLAVLMAEMPASPIKWPAMMMSVML